MPMPPASGLLDALGPVFLLILFGALLGRQGWPGEGFWRQMEGLIYFVLFPAMLISTLANADMNAVPVARLAAVLLGGLGTFAVGLWALRGWLGIAGPAFTSVFQGAIRFNTYVGVAGASALHGSEGAAVAAVAIALMVPLVNVLCVASFAACITQGQRQPRLASSSAALVKNPLILACALGIGLNLSGLGLPAWGGDSLSLLGRAALPLGLMAVGAALNLNALLDIDRGVISSATIKLVLLPLLVVGLARLVGLDTVSRDIALLFAALPTATSAYILARQLGGDARSMAAIITGQTLLAMLTLPLWLYGFAG